MLTVIQFIYIHFIDMFQLTQVIFIMLIKLHCYTYIQIYKLKYFIKLSTVTLLFIHVMVYELYK